MDAQTKHHLVTGREHYQAGEYERARPHLEAVRDAHEDFADVHNMLGVSLQQLGRTDEARHHFERAVEINPAYTEAYGQIDVSAGYNWSDKLSFQAEVINLNDGIQRVHGRAKEQALYVTQTGPRYMFGMRYKF